jgi:hypothetical protein
MLTDANTKPRYLKTSRQMIGRWYAFVERLESLSDGYGQNTVSELETAIGILPIYLVIEQATNSHV